MLKADKDRMKDLTLNDAACDLCAKRESCMPYDDKTLLYGVQNGHVPMMGECEYYLSGNDNTKKSALDDLQEFKAYAKNLITKVGV